MSYYIKATFLSNNGKLKTSKINNAREIDFPDPSLKYYEDIIGVKKLMLQAYVMKERYNQIYERKLQSIKEISYFQGKQQIITFKYDD